MGRKRHYLSSSHCHHRNYGDCRADLPLWFYLIAFVVLSIIAIMCL